MSTRDWSSRLFSNAMALPQSKSNELANNSPSFLLLSRRAEVEESCYIKREVVRKLTSPGYSDAKPLVVDTMYDVFVLMRYPRKEWEKNRQEFEVFHQTATQARTDQPDLQEQI